MKLTKLALTSLVAPQTGREEIRDTEVPGLQVRITSSGARSWSVFRRVKNGLPVRVTIGDAYFVTPTVAREIARGIIANLAIGIKPEKKPTLREQADAARAQKVHTLAALVMAYCDHLQSLGRSSHRDARGIFNLHLISTKPKLAATPARDVTSENIVDLLREVKESGKARTSNKLRAYLGAAYGVAISASASHEIPVAFKAFAITVNPVAATKADSTADKADKNPLSLDELRAYWRAIENVPARDGAMLRLHLLTGGQRIEQLVKLRRDDASADTITLYDSKGRPRGGDARSHVVPLTELAAHCINELRSNGDYLFTTASGVNHIDATTFTRVAAKHGKHIKAFAAKRVRSGVETLLASRGIDQEIRGRLQSHGVAGVQAKHYNAHDYLPEKRKALELLEAALSETDAKVVAIRA